MSLERGEIGIAGPALMSHDHGLSPLVGKFLEGLGRRLDALAHLWNALIVQRRVDVDSDENGLSLKFEIIESVVTLQFSHLRHPLGKVPGGAKVLVPASKLHINSLGEGARPVLP